ncbi:apolipoprotein N-acyltransferase [Endothiovibrio diazotrophicus]
MPVEITAPSPTATPASRLSGLGRVGARAAAAFAGGTLTAVAFLPFGWFPLALAGPWICFHLWERDNGRAAFVHGWLYTVALLSVGGYWLYLSPRELGNIHSPLAEILTGLFIAVMGLYMGLAGLLYVRLHERLPRPGRALLLLPVLWVGAEWLRSWALTGFPWFGLGYAALDTPLAGWGPLVGSHGMSLAVAATAGALAAALRSATLRGLRLPLLAVALLWGGGALLEGRSWTRPTGAPLRVALAQPGDWLRGVDNIDRWARIRPLTEKLLDEADLVVWPETLESLYLDEIDREDADAYWVGDQPLKKTLWNERWFLFDDRPRHFAVAAHQEGLLVGALEGMARARGKSVVAGFSITDNRRGLRYNSLIALGGRNRAVYDKRHLVPFGETLPLRHALSGFWEWLEIDRTLFSDSRNRTNLLPINGHLAGVSICFESAFSDDIRESLPAAHFLIMASSDRAFRGTVEPYQHQQVARMRALESGRWIARTNKTAITAAIAPDGRVASELPPDRQGVLKEWIQPRDGATPYVLLGNGPLLLWGVGVLTVTLLCRRRGR